MRGGKSAGLIPEGNEPKSEGPWRMPREVFNASGACSVRTESERRPHTPLLCSVANMMLRCLQWGCEAVNFSVSMEEKSFW